MNRFYLGTHLPYWLREPGPPLFVSDRQLRRYPLRPARRTWALDSGGFSELSRPPYAWSTSPREYVSRVREYMQMGRMEWAAIQDWMCEPFILRNTGKTLHQHQRNTVRSYLILQDLGPEIPWLPVLQGLSLEDYQRCLAMYRAAGCTNTYFGIGSVCRRQATADIERTIEVLSRDVALHAFGFSLRGLKNAHANIYTADSMAWSAGARRIASPVFDTCNHSNCANCYQYAHWWYNTSVLQFVNAHSRRYRNGASGPDYSRLLQKFGELRGVLVK